VPWMMGLIGTRSISKEIPGIKQIRELNAKRVRSGIEAVKALEAWRHDPANVAARATFEQHQADLGFGLLLKRHVARVEDATPEQIRQAVDSTIPRVAPMFWSFRLMVGLAFLMLALFAFSFASTIKATCDARPWLLRWALWMLPAPWLAAELGWFVAEYGRQPWTIYGALPTHLSVSSLSVASLYGSLLGFVGFYTLLLLIEMFLMVRYARLGPASLGTGRYDGERAAAPTHPVPGLAHGAGPA
jgi:cytochrome bd ubiquinol oxidase subunit I